MEFFTRIVGVLFALLILLVVIETIQLIFKRNDNTKGNDNRLR